MSGQVVTRVLSFEPKHLVGIARSLAMLSVCDRELISSVSVEVIIKVRNFDPEDLSNIVCAHARNHWKRAIVMGMAAEEGILCTKNFQSEYLANTAWAFFKLGIRKKCLADAELM
eukprot:gnl/MRDRNA2_/MRDRNA2_86599_c0_seq3.p2 gnl/MRDRNA2_/MRDRNA2_86599_c0~~gnl/MRDRNA2_/MRDRNA2_86599_c0_seq3.p2  ORF type:complete len:115 (+),score=13.97 gnl/MRDRNA2_/MRDRNA2_86599_c0_seq3:457-801(+)